MHYASELQPAEVFLFPTHADFLPENRRWQGIPSMERSPGGRLFAVFYSGGDTEQNGNYIALCASDDDGAAWRDPIAVIQHPDVEAMRVFDPNVWLDPLGRLWITWAQSHDYFDGRDGVWAAIWEHPDDPRQILPSSPL